MHLCHRFSIAAALVALFQVQLPAQERIAAPKDELREQQAPRQHPDIKDGPEIVPQSPRRTADLTDVLVNNNNGATATSNFTQSETDIVAYGNFVIIGFNDAGSFSSGSRFTGWSYSTDGGVSFTDGGALPATTIGDAGDPVLARNETTGRVYLSTLGFNSPSTIQMWRSDNNGATWMAPVNATPGGSSEDKQWHTVDNFPGPGNGNVYVISRSFGGANGIYIYRSTNNGDSFIPSGGVNIVSGQQGAFVAVGPDHSVYAFWYAGTTLQMRKSTDFGATFGAAVTVASGLIGGTNGDLGLTGIRQGTATAASFRSSQFPHVAINPVSGHLYVTYDNDAPGVDKADVFLVQSTDGGATWSAPLKVNDDATTTDQWQPTIAVTPNGIQLGVFYYSRQEDAANNLFKYYGRIASISGATLNFQPSFAISDVASLPEFGRDAPVVGTYMGDYNHAAATVSAFHVVWSDNRDDLPGGAPRKDPNVYYDRISIINTFARGTITNASTSNPFPGVTIDVVEPVPQFNSVSAANGSYLIGAFIEPPATTANFTLRARKFGFRDTTMTVMFTANDTLTRNIAVSPYSGAALFTNASSITFQPTQVNFTRRDSIKAYNTGLQSLNITSMTTTNPRFTVAPTSAVVASGDSTYVRVTYAPLAEGADTGRVIILSNSQTASRLDIMLSATAFGAAIVVVRPDSFQYSLSQGDSITGSLSVRNSGTGTLNYTTVVSGGYVGEETQNIGNPVTSTATASTLLRGGVVNVTSRVLLTEIRSWLTITSSRELRYYIYENTSGTSYTRIFESIIASSGTGGPQWYSSGPVNVVLESGKTYAMGVAWPAASGLTYSYQLNSPIPVTIPFGTITGGLAVTSAGFPPPATIDNSQTSTLYYTQLVTSSTQWLTTTTNSTGSVAPGDSTVLGFRIRTALLGGGNTTAALAINSNAPSTPVVSVPVHLHVTTGIAQTPSGIPDQYSLAQNYPNPFNPTTRIAYSLPEESSVKLTVYNILGQQLVTLVDAPQTAGHFTAEWNGRTSFGSSVATGVYFYKLHATATHSRRIFQEFRKMVLLK